METQFWHCDRCAERIQPGDRVAFKWIAGARRFSAPTDLCGACAAELDGWLGPGPAPGRRRVTEVEGVKVG